jgi:methionyl-tRNA formyltransferase
MNFIILSEKIWNRNLKEKLEILFPADTWYYINSKQEFTVEKLDELQPSKIFIPHWSYIIPKEIYEKFECVVFHMTDLPYGRGGSPLQNLIVRGHENTKISALRVSAGLDTGDVYLKHDLNLNGTAEEIFLRAGNIIEEMIIQIILENKQATPQKGEPILFKRRVPEDSNLSTCKSIKEFYDYIRMLDAEGYPKAYIEFGNFRLEFSRASLKADNSIVSDVKIISK